MNVTVKIQDELGREARHRAVDAGLSLSGWVSALIAKELSRKELSPESKPKTGTLLDALGCDALDGVDIEFPRDKTITEPMDFS